MFYVYVLKSGKNGDLYKGFTSDLKKRICEHNKGVTQTTKTNGPWKLIYYEAIENETDARKEEIFLKAGKGRERLNRLLQSMESGQDGNALVSKTSSGNG